MQGKLHEPTDENRKLVRGLAAVGVRHEDIAAKIELSADTLVKYYKKELDDGRIYANAAVAKSLYQQAMAGNTTAMIFWLKTRAKWHESIKHEITGQDGQPVSMQISWAQPE